MSLKVLKPHQKNVLIHAAETDVDRLFLYHSLGSGKTITSLALAYTYKLVLKIPEKILIICPVSLIENFKKEIRFLKFQEDLFEIISYNRLIRKLSTQENYLQNKIVICDEIHNYRNNNKSTNALIKATHSSKRVILLSATPIVNSVDDFAPIIAILNKVTLTRALGMLYKESAIKDKVLCYSVPLHELKANYPNVKYHTVKIEMTSNYYKEYQRVENEETDKLPQNFKQKDYTVFLNGLRQASNRLYEESSKIVWIIQHFVRESQKKTLIYSNWKDSGIYLIRDLLEKAKIKTGVIDGTLSAVQRQDIIDKYNADKIKVLLISSAGTEGIDLKGTREVIILEPHWNVEKINQVIGRAVRYNSHKALSESKQIVDVYNLLLVKPKKTLLGKLLRFFEKQSVDEMILGIANSKQENSIKYINYIKNICSGK